MTWDSRFYESDDNLRHSHRINCSYGMLTRDDMGFPSLVTLIDPIFRTNVSKSLVTLNKGMMFDSCSGKICVSVGVVALVDGWPYVWIAVAIRWPNPSSLSCIGSGNASYV